MWDRRELRDSLTQAGSNPGNSIPAGTGHLDFSVPGWWGQGIQEQQGTSFACSTQVLFSFHRIQGQRKEGISFHYPSSDIAKRQRLMPLKHKQLVLKHNMADLL